MQLTKDYVVVGLRKAESIHMRPSKEQPEEVKINFFPDPPPPATHQPKYTKLNQEGRFKAVQQPAQQPPNPLQGALNTQQQQTPQEQQTQRIPLPHQGTSYPPNQQRI